MPTCLHCAERSGATGKRPSAPDAHLIDKTGEDGVPNRVRTCDLLIKSQLLYQLSYGHDRRPRKTEAAI